MKIKNTVSTLTVASLLFSCGEAKISNHGDMGNSDLHVSCKNLTETECKSTSGCTVVLGSPYDGTRECRHPEIFVACAATVFCNNGIRYTHQDENDVCWYISGGCFSDELPEVKEKCKNLDDANICQ